MIKSSPFRRHQSGEKNFWQSIGRGKLGYSSSPLPRLLKVDRRGLKRVTLIWQHNKKSAPIESSRGEDKLFVRIANSNKWSGERNTYVLIQRCGWDKTFSWLYKSPDLKAHENMLGKKTIVMSMHPNSVIQAGADSRSPSRQANNENIGGKRLWNPNITRKPLRGIYSTNWDIFSSVYQSMSCEYNLNVFPSCCGLFVVLIWVVWVGASSTSPGNLHPFASVIDRISHTTFKSKCYKLVEDKPNKT